MKKCKEENPGVDCYVKGLSVFPNCAEGFKKWGLECVRECPENFTDDGLFCRKPKGYSRGIGYPLWSKKKCEKEHPEGCQKTGLLIYPLCKPGKNNDNKYIFI